jgi:hypothetical protein
MAGARKARTVNRFRRQGCFEMGILTQRNAPFCIAPNRIRIASIVDFRDRVALP